MAGLGAAWRLRADRAADEVGRLVDQTTARSPWSVAGDFLLLSGVWAGGFALLTMLGRLVVKRASRRPFLARRQRLQGLLGYVVPYTIPALICLPLTLYVSHFLAASVGRALALCFAYATSSGIFSTSLLLCVIVMFNVGHKRPAVRIIRDYCPKPLFLIGFLAALSDALTSPQIARQLGGNITSSIAVFTGLFAAVIFGVLVVRLRRPVAHLIRNRPLAQRLKHPALQQSLRVFSGLWYWPILLMVLAAGLSGQRPLAAAWLKMSISSARDWFAERGVMASSISAIMRIVIWSTALPSNCFRKRRKCTA